MESKPLIIYYNDADGTKKVRCKVPKWQFTDKAMSVGEQYVSFNLESEVPINFTVGDYCIYRGQYFYLNNLPTTEQRGGVRKVGDAFKYDTVRFDSDSEKLGRIIMLDITPTTGDYVAAKGTNFTGSSQFQLYCAETKVTVNGKTRILTPVCYLANLLKANLDRAFPDDGWQVHVNLASTETKYGKTQLVTHTDDKVLSFDGTTAAAALAEANNTFDLDYFIKGRDIYIGYTLSSITSTDTSVKEDTSKDTFFYFGYGRGYADSEHQGKALFDIKRNANANQNVITRLRAFGSTKNMPYRYYNKKYNLPQSLFPTNLQLPDTFEKPEVKAANNADRKKTYPFLREVKGDTNDSYIEKNDDALSTAEGLREGRAKWDGSDSKLEEIYPTIKEGTYRDLRAAEQPDSDGYTESSTKNTDANGKHSFLNYLDDERVDELLSPGKINGDTILDDANVGEGIDEDPAASARGTVDVPYDYSGQEYLSNPFSTWLKDIKNNLLWSMELGVIPDQYAGNYTFSPNFQGDLVVGVKVSVEKSDASHIVNISYQFVVYATPRSGGQEKAVYTFTSERTGLTSSTKYTEIPIAAIPKEGENITLTEACSVRIVMKVIAEFTAGQFGDKDLVTCFIGRKTDVASTNTAFSAQFRWGPVDKSAEYLNTPFHIIIKDMGFDLKAQFNGKDSPCVEMTDGYCTGRKFKIGDDVQKVTYKKNGKSYIGYQLSLTRASDTSVHKYYPSDTDPIKSGDHYILTGIQMPDVYVRMAETRLLIAATQYLADNDEMKYTYEPSLDNIYLARNYDRCKKDGDVTKSVYWNLYAGLKFPFRGLPETGAEDETLPFINITIESITIKEEDGLTPKVEMTLNEDIEQSTYNKITTAVDRIYDGSLMNEFLSNASLGGTSKSDMIALIQEQGKLKFLSKLLDDTASGLITFVKGLVSKAKAVFENAVEIVKDLTVGGNAAIGGNVSVGGDSTVKGNASVGDSLTADDIHSRRYSDALDQSSGMGYHIWVNGSTSNAIFDNLSVRGKWTASVLEVMKLQYSAGNITIDGAGGEIFAVEPFGKDGESLIPTDNLITTASTGNLLSDEGKVLKEDKKELPYSDSDVFFYRCYFKATDGEKNILNMWHVGDQARCQTFNLSDGTHLNAQNKTYFRVVINKSDVTVLVDGTPCFYIDLSNVQNGTLTGDDGKEYNYRGLLHSKADDGTVTWLTNDAPEKGDQVAHVGNVYDEERQGAVQLVAVGAEKGLYVYDGINETLESLADFIHIKWSPKNSLLNSTFVTITNGYHSNNPYIYCGDWHKGVTAHPSEVWQYGGGSWVCNVKTQTVPREDSTETITKSDGTTEKVAAWSAFAQKGESAVQVIVLTDKGVTLRQGMTETTMIAHVYLGGEEITESIEPSRFSWYRTSNNPDSDVAWNETHSGVGNVVKVTKSEVLARSMFECAVDYKQ